MSLRSKPSRPFAWWHACVSLLAAACVISHAQSAHPAALDQAKAAMQSGLAAAQRGDLAAARRDFERVVQLAPGVEMGHAALGSVLLGLGEAQRAEKELTRAHQQQPSDVATTLNLARAEVTLGQYAQGVQLFSDAARDTQAPPLSTDETISYAFALQMTQRTADAQTLLEQAVARDDGDAVLHDALGSILASQHHEEDALKEFYRALQIAPGNITAREHLATALLALDRSDAAVDAAELAESAAPRQFATELLLGRALSAAHRDDDALQHLHIAASSHPEQQPADAVYALALALQASGDAKGALPVFQLALDSTDRSATFSHSSALTNYALARVQTGDAVGALQLYAEALRLGPDTPTLREDYGAAYLQKADIDAAIRQFKAGLALEPDNALLHYDLGLAYKLQDKLDLAVPEFEHAATLDTSLPDPPYTLGVIYMQQGRFNDAATSLRQAVALNPANGDAWALLGSVLKDSGNPSDAPAAVAALRKAVELEPDQPSLHIQLAALDMDAGDREEAAKERKIAADLSRAANNHQRANFALRSGKALLEQNKLDEATLQLKTAAQAEPALVEPHQLLAEIYTRQGKTAEAAVERAQAQQLQTQGKDAQKSR